MSNSVYYPDHLSLDTILDSLQPESRRLGNEAHDETFFLTIHQVCELWFRQILFELDSITSLVRCAAPNLTQISNRLQRIVDIWQQLQQQVSLFDSMSVVSFAEFRDLLGSSSGAQSYQSKIIDVRIGTYKSVDDIESQLNRFQPHHAELIRESFSPPSLITSINHLFLTLPLVNNADCDVYLERFKQPKIIDARFSPRALKSALYVRCHADEISLALHNNILDCCIALDEQMANWRFQHLQLAHKMIGNMVGTAGTSGIDYLLEKVYRQRVFNDLVGLASCFV